MKKILILVAVVAYLQFLLTQLPANLVLDMTRNLLVDIEIAEPRGTFWEGSSPQVRYRNVDLGRLEWDARPFHLLLGEWNNRIRLEGNFPGYGNLGLMLGNRMTLGDAFLDLELSDLARFSPQLGLLNGKLSANIVHLAMQEGVVSTVEGVVRLENLVIPTGENLGNFFGELTTDSEATRRLEFNSEGQEGIDATGVLTLTAEDKVDLDLLVKNPDALGSASGLFTQVARQEPQGYRFKWSGSLAFILRFL